MSDQDTSNDKVMDVRGKYYKMTQLKEDVAMARRVVNAFDRKFHNFENEVRDDLSRLSLVEFRELMLWAQDGWMSKDMKDKEIMASLVGAYLSRGKPEIEGCEEIIAWIEQNLYFDAY